MIPGTTLARWSAMTPMDRLLSRLDDGAGWKCIFLPFVGEFGHEVMSHMRLVHFHRAAEKIVCCRKGNEVLYPSASAFVTEWIDPVSDTVRIGTMRNRRYDWSEILELYPFHYPIRAGSLSLEQEIAVVHPGERIPLAPRRRGFRADVVLGVRRRAFAPERNWPHWQYLANGLRAAGLTFAVIGDRATSGDLEGQHLHSGHFDTDAAIELLENCKLYVGQDSGSSHLAAAVGAPMTLFREERGGSRDLTGRMADVNPGNVRIVAGGWDRPELVLHAALSRLIEDHAAHR